MAPSISLKGTITRPVQHLGPKSIGGDQHAAQVDIELVEGDAKEKTSSLWSLTYGGVRYEAEKPYDLIPVVDEETAEKRFSLSIRPKDDHCCCIVFKGVEWPEKPSDMELDDKVTYAKICVGGKDTVLTEQRIECPLYISTPMGTWKAGTTYNLAAQVSSS
mmetsp:Transcript_879/g.3240  ORF Transcript_879/g.3240 Transcript_879/m.3240 type:complete len:161 (+) Transcript_879:80-562(+)